MQLIHPRRPGQAIIVPDQVADSYLADGWVRPGADPVDPVAGMTVAQLRAYAAAHDIDLAGARRKADIADRVRSGLEPE